jgi:hypothetical protein
MPVSYQFAPFRRSSFKLQAGGKKAMGNILTSLFGGCVSPPCRVTATRVASGKPRKQSWPDGYSSRCGTVTVVALSLVSHRGWQKGKCVNGCPVLRVQTEQTHGMSHVTGTKAIQHPTGPTPMAINILVDIQLEYTHYSILTLLALKLACLISYLLLLPFNPPKEPIKVYYVASLNGRGTLPSPFISMSISL